VLKVRAQKRGIACTVDSCTIGEGRDCRDYDLVFFGGGADREQTLIYEDLLSGAGTSARPWRKRPRFC
jgi:CobQ-like glutamine amidotransferase family enzyme